MEVSVAMIKYQITKKYLSLFSDAKVFSSRFIKWFLTQLADKYILYELADTVRLVNIELTVN